jgi:uncharacterized protein (TIGR01777 family)
MLNNAAMQAIKTVLITGASGLIGTQLSKMLIDEGYNVVHLGRKSTRKSVYPTFFWDVDNGQIDTNAFKNVDAIIHLAGAGVADSRWTEDRKREIINSRVNSGRLLYETLKNTSNQVKTFVSASAVGYYGNRYQEVLTETAQPTNEFLSRTTQNWEDASAQMAELGIRTVILRIGIVLSEKGGALPQTALPLKLRVGAYFGSGKQYYSWIHITDICRIFMHALQTPNMSGIYNSVAPNPVNNKEFVRNIAVAMGKPAVFVPAPAFVLQLAMGEMSHIVLDSAYVSADKLLQTGFVFKYPQIELALKEIYGDVASSDIAM